MSATFMLRESIDWTDSMVLIVFPTAGNAGNIAGHYIRKQLDLPLLGSIHVEGQEGVVAVEDGIAAAPLRIYGGQVECNLGDERCPTVYVIGTDLPLGPSAASIVTDAILEETRGARLLLCLDAVARDEDDDTPDVYCTSPDPNVLAALKGPNVTPLAAGIIVGLSGNVLLGAERKSVPAGALLVEATKDLPDGHAAAAMVRAIDRLIPQVKVDPGPLLKEAAELERQVRQAQNDVESHQRNPNFATYI